MLMKDEGKKYRTARDDSLTIAPMMNVNNNGKSDTNGTKIFASIVNFKS